MKILYEFIPRLDFVSSAAKVKDLVDGFNITDSAGGAPAPGGISVACVLKQIYPDKVTIPMMITNKRVLLNWARLLLPPRHGCDGILPDPGDPPKYGTLIRTREDGSCQTISDPDEILAYRRSTGPAEEVRNFLRKSVKISKTKIGCLLTARVPAEAAIERMKNEWDFGFFLRLEESTLPKLKEIGTECKRMGKSFYPYFIVGTEKTRRYCRGSAGQPRNHGYC
jgi:hypothetical protein